MNKKKTGTVAAVVSCVAAIAIAGTYTFNDYRQSKDEKEIAQAEETTTDLIINTEEEMDNEADASDAQASAGNPADLASAEDLTASANSASVSSASEQASANAASASSSAAAASQTATPSFSSESKMLWPVSGNVLMNYSMDKTIYFKTLDQYKYNPALIISSAVGDQVLAGAPGHVKSIDNSAKTGITVNVDLGNGYEAFYGQLKDVTLKVGDSVDAKTVVGYVAEPTKYYSVEGTNVYFEMRKDGRPVNPMEYLVSEGGSGGDGVF